MVNHHLKGKILSSLLKDTGVLQYVMHELEFMLRCVNRYGHTDYCCGLPGLNRCGRAVISCTCSAAVEQREWGWESRIFLGREGS